MTIWPPLLLAMVMIIRPGRVTADQVAATTITSAQVGWTAAGTALSGYLVKPVSGTHLPGALLVPGEDGRGKDAIGRDGLDEAAKQATRRMAAKGFVAFAVDYDPERVARQSELVRTVAEPQLIGRLKAAVDWLAAQPSVDSQRIAVIGWAEGASWVLKLSQQGVLAASAVVSGPICSDAAMLFQARNPILAIVKTRLSGCTPEIVDRLKQQVAAGWSDNVLVSTNAPIEGFPGLSDASGATQRFEPIWREIDRFLDARLNFLSSSSNLSSASPVRLPDSPDPARVVGTPGPANIQDIMRVILSDDGVRGNLARLIASPRLLEAWPAGREVWEQARSQAAVVAESATWLTLHDPPNGSMEHWRERAAEFGTAARELLHALERRDLATTRYALQHLPATCATCHADYR